MRLQDLKVGYKEIECDDEELLNMYYEAKLELAKIKKTYDEALLEFDEYNYGDFLIKELYYKFAKESFSRLDSEINNRGLSSGI